jgi:hypothetical protein
MKKSYMIRESLGQTKTERSSTLSIDRYIESLSLTDSTLSSSPFSDLEKALGPTRSGTAPAPPQKPIPDDLQAAVDVGTVLSFVDGVSPQERDDVLFSLQLAQRGASGAFDRFTQTQSWYQKCLEVLENLGWAAEQFAFAKYDQSKGELRMDKAALAIIGAIATQNQLAVLQQAVKALEALAEDDDAIRLFDFQTSAQMSGNFQIGAVQKADNGALSLAMGAFYFRSVDVRRRFLFVSWGGESVNFWTAAQKMTLNATFYTEHRDQVREKLGLSARSFIGELTLG